MEILRQQKQQQTYSDVVKKRNLTQSQLGMPKLKQDKGHKRSEPNWKGKKNWTRSRSFSAIDDLDDADADAIVIDDDDDQPISVPISVPLQGNTKRLQMKWKPFIRGNNDSNEGVKGYKRAAPADNDDVTVRFSKSQSAEPTAKRRTAMKKKKKGIVEKITYKPKQRRDTTKDIQNMTF